MTDLPLVVYTHGGGRLGNQLIRFAHWIAWTREHPGQVEVLDMAFWPYAAYFSMWHDAPACVFPARANSLDRLALWYHSLPVWCRRRLERRIPWGMQALGCGWPRWQTVNHDAVSPDGIDLEAPEFYHQVMRRRVTICSGWKIAGWNFFGKHQAELRKVFRPKPAAARRAEEFIAALRREHDIIVGVLIRHGDYRVWRGGEFFFPASVYAGWIRQLLELHAGRRVAVVIASDEWQSPASFAGLPCHFATGSVNLGGPWFESFVELSLCDLVISPPSTFAAAAAFVGKVPLWPVAATDQTLDFDQILPDAMVDAARHPQFSKAVN